MPPKSSVTLTEAELRLMRVLWQRGESAVAELVTAIADATPLAYTSVLTTIRVLEKKGYVCHRQAGRAFLYSAIVAQKDAGRSEVRHVLQRFFGDSREKLLLSLLGEQAMTAEELLRIRRAIDEAADDRRPERQDVSRAEAGR
jgi:predicted transcriptional regulator